MTEVPSDASQMLAGLSHSEMRDAANGFDMAMRALEQSPWCKPPSESERWRRRLRPLTLRVAPKRSLEDAFVDLLATGMQATLRFYGLRPSSGGFAKRGWNIMRLKPWQAMAQAMAELQRASSKIVALERPDLANRPNVSTPACTFQAKFNKHGGSAPLITCFIEWRKDASDASPVDYCVPLLVAYQRSDGSFGYPNAAVNALPDTFAKRGHVPFRLTGHGQLEPMD